VDQAITANGHATIKNTGGPPGQALGQAAFFGAGGFTGLEVMAVYKHAADPPSDPNGVGGCFQFTQQDVFPPHQPWTDGHFYEDFGLTTRTDLGLPGVNTAAAFVCYNISVKSDNTSYNAWVKSANFFSIAGGYVFTQQGVHDAADGYRLGVVRWYGMQDYYFTGNTAAIYVWNRQLTAGERTSMRNYITAVYGTAF
jgi:hypothetical protein